MKLTIEQHSILLNAKLERFLGNGNLLEKFKPFLINDNLSFTKISRADDAVSLNPLTGNNKIYSSETSSDDGGVVRAIVGFNMLKKLNNADDSYFYFTISQIVNNALCSLTKNLGNLEGRKVMAGTPGMGYPSFARMLESYAGFELRFYVLDIETEKKLNK